MSVIPVATAQPYNVVVAAGARHEFAGLVADTVAKIAIIHAGPVTGLAHELAGQVTDREVLLLPAPEGERAKTADFLTKCWSALAKAGFTRTDLVVGVGGGATTDFAGFVAATWLRGVNFITVPTSVLGMVDAAVGGKTGINIPEGKNLVGAFHEPIGVLCDTDVLATLPDAEVRGGMAEIVKCGFIADPSILDDVESNPGAALDPHGDLLTSLIVRGIQVKADTVAVDLKEASGAALGGDGSIGREALNYGHTLGHAIERHTYFACSHGEAISVGMVFAAELAHDSGLIDSRLLARHRAILDRVGLPTGYSAATLDEMLDAMALDKKTRAGTLRFVVLDALANPVILEGPDAALLRRAFDAVSAGPSSVVGGAR